MASSIGYETDRIDPDQTTRLPAADRTITDLVPPHPELAAWLARSEAITLDAIEESDLWIFSRF